MPRGPLVLVLRASLRPAVRAELPPLQTRRLLDQLRERIRFLHYSRRTEEAYVHWCRAFVRFHGLRHPRELKGPAVISVANSGSPYPRSIRHATAARPQTQ
jgi:hypothetical protein